MNTVYIFFAKYAIVFPVLIVLYYFWKQPRDKKKEFIIFGVTALVTTGILVLIASHLYYNPRPFVVGNFTPLIPHAADNGFPSDHMLLASAIAVIVSFYDRKSNRRIVATLWILAILIGISRILVGVHHPIDIIGSAVIALVGAGSAYFITKKKKTDSTSSH